uniref:Macaca fascicularis brain cDNA clone: QflA-18676, similar to human O-acyltransferase (membrane bound) domain containing 1(OACT1), mRNA, RefSeq: XM_371801.2 n=1 Tax=Macaca fascicularis TaxID=9541 RepID=I7G5V4_MACFA|nr:unnamed protein product [Macaca fascicularis]
MLICVCVSPTLSSKYTKSILTELKQDKESNIIIVGYLNTPVSVRNNGMR